MITAMPLAARRVQRAPEQRGSRTTAVRATLQLKQVGAAKTLMPLPLDGGPELQALLNAIDLRS